MKSSKLSHMLPSQALYTLQVRLDEIAAIERVNADLTLQLEANEEMAALLKQAS